MSTQERKQTDEGREARALRSASLTGDEIPTRVLLAPWGNVESTNGSFVVDAESAELAAQAFSEHGTDLPIDYEHQTLGGTYSSPNGQAPAAGWIKGIVAQPGVGLLADIEWTEPAKEMLGAKEYRYLSPVAIIRKTDRKLVAIHSAALTNKPAIVAMQPIVNCLDTPPDGAQGQPLAVLRAELDLAPDVVPEEVLLAASQRFAQLRREAQRRHVEDRVREAIQVGKLVEAQRTWAETLVAKEEELFDEWLRTTPVVVARGVSAPPTGGDGAEQSHRAIAAKARAEFRANRMLSGLTTEEAYVADTLRERRRRCA